MFLILNIKLVNQFIIILSNFNKKKLYKALNLLILFINLVIIFKLINIITL